MRSVWLAVVLTGLGSYAFRVIPMLLGERIQLSGRAEATLRHAGVGSLTALLVVGVRQLTTETMGPDTIAVALALASSGTVAMLGRRMPLVVLCGGVAYGLSLTMLRLLTG